MCLPGTYKTINIINPNQNKKSIVVDACIADEVQELNNNGIVILGCCCGHGKAGEIVEWDNGFGRWKSHQEPPHALIIEDSVQLVKELGYRPFKYYYADGEFYGVWQMQLKSGCLTIEDCKDWHAKNGLPNTNEIEIIR